MKNWKKRFTSLLLAIVMCLSLGAPALAAEEPEPLLISTEVLNEYAYISFLKNAPAARLMAMDISQQEAEETVSGYEAALRDRAALSDLQLEGFGYTKKEISVLRAYAAGEPVTEAELLSTAAVCTGKLYKNSFGQKAASFYYEWSWDKAPTYLSKDSVAMKWSAFDKQGSAFDVTRAAFSGGITYYCGNDSFSRSGVFQNGVDDNAVNYQFPAFIRVSDPYDAGYLDYYPKTGTVSCSIMVPAQSIAIIHYMKVAAVYAHSIKSDTFPSISIGLPYAISISFTNSSDIFMTGNATVTIDKTSP